VSQQSMKPTGGDRGFNNEGFPFVSISVHLLALVVTQGRVLLVVFIFVIDIVVLLLQLLLLNRYFLSYWAPKYH
jgi:polyferredoxin